MLAQESIIGRPLERPPTPLAGILVWDACEAFGRKCGGEGWKGGVEGWKGGVGLTLTLASNSCTAIPDTCAGVRYRLHSCPF